MILCFDFSEGKNSGFDHGVHALQKIFLCADLEVFFRLVVDSQRTFSLSSIGKKSLLL